MSSAPQQSVFYRRNCAKVGAPLSQYSAKFNLIRNVEETILLGGGGDAVAFWGLFCIACRKYELAVTLEAFFTVRKVEKRG
jgi:hypothetical protein